MLPELVAASGCAELTYVAPLGVSAGAVADLARLAERARVVEVGPVVGSGLPTPDWARQPGLPGLCHAVRAVRDHVDARDPDYLRREPLRLLTAADATLALVDATAAADALIELATDAGTLGHRFTLTSATPIPVRRLFELVGRACGVRLLPVADAERCTAVDRLLREWLGEFPLLLGPATPAVHRNRVSARLDATPATIADQLGAHTAGTERAVVPVGRAETTLPPVVLVNALGQGPGYWTELMAGLAPRQVLLVSERETDGSDDEQWLADQVRDLAGELAGQGITRCHLVGWCTAAKVLLGYHHQLPDTVLSLTFLNGSFRQPGQPSELDTDYERELEQLAGVIAGRPELAGRVLRMFTSAMFGQPAADAPDPAAAVVTAPDPVLDEERRAPFRTADALRRYTRRLVRFWSHDVSAEIAGVRAPTLFLVGARDAIVAPRAQLKAAARFGDARIEVLAEGTHYLMHDHAALVADLLAEFCAEAEQRLGAGSSIPRFASSAYQQSLAHQSKSTHALRVVGRAHHGGRHPGQESAGR